MKKNLIVSAIFASTFLFITTSTSALAQEHQQQEATKEEKGPNNGRMLRDGDFAIELAIFETDVPPEFRIYASNNGTDVAVQELDVTVKLTRLGNVIDTINFYREGSYLRGDMAIYEPHSFAVTVIVQYAGRTYQWQYDNFEGRVTIADDLANTMDIKTSHVNQKILQDLHRAYGKLVLAPNATRHISARFAGEVKNVHVRQGQHVKKGQVLLTIESDSNLRNYDILSPINGIVMAQMTGTGEQTGQRNLLTITDTSTLIAQIAVFGDMRHRIPDNAPVSLSLGDNMAPISTEFFEYLPTLTTQQARIYRAKIDNSRGLFNIGQFAKADISLGTFNAPMAVNKAALQAFRDFTVVYAKVGEQYEVRMLDLGRESGDWVEVKSGINVGTQYVSTNSYIIKADIEKSGASHDH